MRDMKDDEMRKVDQLVSDIAKKYGVDENTASGAILLFGDDLNEAFMARFKEDGFVKCVPMAMSLLRTRTNYADDLARSAMTLAGIALSVEVAAIVAAITFIATL